MKRLFFTFFLFLSFTAFADNQPTEQQVSDRLDELYDDSVTLPKDMLSELDIIISHSHQQQWTKNYATAQTLKAELLTFLEQLPQAMGIVEELLPICQAHDYSRLVSRLKLVKLGILDSQGFTPEVETLIKELLATAEQADEPRDAGSIYSTVGHSYYTHRMMDLSIVYLQKAYDIYLPLNDRSNLSFVLNSLANLYAELEDYETSVAYLDQAIAINRELGDVLSVSIMLYNKGKTNTLANNLDDALAALEESLEIAIKIEDELGQIWAKQAIADVYLKQNKAQQALALFKKSAPVFQENGDTREYLHALQGMFDSYFLLEEYDQCDALLPQIKTLLSTLKSPDYDASISKRVSKLHAKRGHFQQAYQHLLTYVELKKTIDDKSNLRNIQTLKISFDTEKKNHENKLLQKENQLQQIKIQQQQNERLLWLVIISMACVLIVVIATLLYRQSLSRNLYRSLALKDSLTGSPNRRAILNTSKIQLQWCQSTHTSFSIAIVDLDKFKQVNDLFGHEAGDEVLKAFSDACKSTLRKVDHFGRYGGEEWLFIFEEDSTDAISAIFQRIRKSLNASNISGYPKDRPITFSVGVASLNRQYQDSLQTLINKADSHLYEAKNKGRDSIVFDSTSACFDTNDSVTI